MIKVNNLVKRYGDIRAVDDTTFTVAKETLLVCLDLTEQEKLQQ